MVQARALPRVSERVRAHLKRLGYGEPKRQPKGVSPGLSMEALAHVGKLSDPRVGERRTGAIYFIARPNPEFLRVLASAHKEELNPRVKALLERALANSRRASARENQLGLDLYPRREQTAMRAGLQLLGEQPQRERRRR
jgi:hypothetical protein